MYFYFECNFCEGESKELGKEYTRLAPGQSWCCEDEDCKKDAQEKIFTIVRALADGHIVEETDF
jgi:hypothetical protein